MKLYEKGLAYQKTAPVNWCPSCCTVLANEQVKDGSCDRCDNNVTKKELKQVTETLEKLLKKEKQKKVFVLLNTNILVLNMIHNQYIFYGKILGKKLFFPKCDPRGQGAFKFNPLH